MSESSVDLLHATLRWLHVGAAVFWVGSAFAFGTLRRRLEKLPDESARRAIALQAYPGLLGWLRWGAALTWILGFVMLFLLYYRTPLLLDSAGLDPVRLGNLLQPDGRPSPRA
ncbi:MAG: hypothetical protein ACKO4Q_08750, partial [Planctomycetota bacterium]